MHTHDGKAAGKSSQIRVFVLKVQDLEAVEGRQGKSDELPMETRLQGMYCHSAQWSAKEKRRTMAFRAGEKVALTLKWSPADALRSKIVSAPCQRRRISSDANPVLEICRRSTHREAVGSVHRVRPVQGPKVASTGN
eukprot:scaffold1187_cov258-Pinguiococcus_pyrenoidosus.AAC.13